MAVAQFGSKIFSVSKHKISTFSNLSISASLKSEEQEISGKKPSTSIKSVGLKNLSISLSLQRNLGVDVLLEIETTAWLEFSG